MSYRPAGSGGGVWTPIETVTISNQATVEMDLTGSHSQYVLHIDNLVPVTDATDLYLRFSVDGGSTFLSGASDYAWSVKTIITVSITTVNSAADSQVELSHSSNNLGNTTDECLNGFVYIHNAKQTTKAVSTTSPLFGIGSNGQSVTPYGRGALIANIDEVDAIQLLASSGNLSTGRVSLYGVDTA